MAEPWIRVHAGLIHRPVIARAVDALGVNDHAAVGLLVTFWGNVSLNCPGGLLAEVADQQIERWALWRGKRGKFAAFIRAYHTDPDGRVSEWMDYAGKLEQRRETERTRLRNKRNGVAQQDANTSATVGEMLLPARVNDHDHEHEHLLSSGGRPRDVRLVAAANKGLSEHPARPQPIPRVLVGQGSTVTALEELQGIPDDFAEAMIYERAKSHTSTKWVSSLRYFVGYVKDRWAEAEAAEQAKSATPPSVTRTDAAAVFASIRALCESHITPNGVKRSIPLAAVEAMGPAVVRAYKAIGGSSRLIDNWDSEREMSFIAKDFAKNYTPSAA